MKFSKDYSKLSLNEFTTIRKRTIRYFPGSIIKIITPKQSFKAEIISRILIGKNEITEEFAQKDADCSRKN